MKKIWGLIIYFLVLLLVLGFFVSYALSIRKSSSVVLEDESPIVLGLSIVEQDFSIVLANLNNQNEDALKNIWITSFLLQSPSPAAQVYLDYIFVPADDKIQTTKICFVSISTTKNQVVPFEVVSNEIAPSGLEDTHNAYIYNFPENRCVQKGSKYIMPHVLLGVVPVDSYANFLLWRINGFRALDFFPLDEQKITLDISANSDELGKISPSIDVVVAKNGWDGNFNQSRNESPIIHLTRPGFYKWVLLGFFLIMALIIPFLNDVLDESGGFFEVAFGLLLGLWGMHEILTPEYIKSSIPIDIAIYSLYILVIVEIVIVLFYERQKRRLLIIDINKGTTGNEVNTEYVLIKNPSFLPITMTGWFLLDKGGNRFKFPVFILRGKSVYKRDDRNFVKIWTKDGDDDKANLFWAKGSSVWADRQDTAYLDDSQGITIATKNKR